ncbi:hypothetical protein [Umezawaea beigongshangensis]|uniref:hypothetical protein n=1 Tax=Umezawaea beigongshangensis TaxID=2780383 RepID=UPI0018F2169F|nr:hypothetical protein [Umezawaea beigongshangensis]
MSVPRTVIWTPAPAAELQLALHRATAGPAVLVPVASGTVALPPIAGFGVQVRHAARCREVAGRALLLRWNAVAAVACSLEDEEPLSCAVGPLRAARSLVRWFPSRHGVRLTATPGEVLGGDAPAATAGGPEGLAAVLRAVGRPDLAQVVGLVDEGRADTWITGLPGTADLPINTVLPVIPVTQGTAPHDPPLA